MSIVTDTGKFTGAVDLALGSAIASAATVNLGAATGNTVTVTGTTTITSLGTASQAGVKRLVIFTDALILTHGSNLVCFGEANITTTAGDVAEFVATTTTVWRMIRFNKLGATTNGLIDSDGLANNAVTSTKIGDAAVIHSKRPTRIAVAMTDADATLTAEDFVGSGLFTAAITANRVKTTPTAVQIIALLPGYQVGTAFEITIVKTGAFTLELAPGAGVTIEGEDTISATTPKSASALVVVTSPTAVSIYTK